MGLLDTKFYNSQMKVQILVQILANSQLSVKSNSDVQGVAGTIA